jgi:hypothetical protein
VLEHFKIHTPKGEFVLILGGVGLQQDAEIEEEED